MPNLRLSPPLPRRSSINLVKTPVQADRAREVADDIAHFLQQHGYSDLRLQRAADGYSWRVSTLQRALVIVYDSGAINVGGQWQQQVKELVYGSFGKNWRAPQARGQAPSPCPRTLMVKSDDQVVLEALASFLRRCGLRAEFVQI